MLSFSDSKIIQKEQGGKNLNSDLQTFMYTAMMNT